MTYQEFIEFCSVKCPQSFEVHHIEPLSIGGVDVDANKIKLSGEDHYTAHKLLALEHPYNLKLQQAWWQVYVTHKTCAAEGDYEILRQRLTSLPILHTEESRQKRSNSTKRMMSQMTPEQKEQWKQKISESNKAFYASHPESKKQISESLKATYRSHPEKCSAISKRMKGKPGTPHTKEFKDLVRQRQTGRKWFTDGVLNVFEYECPEGFIPGITRKKGKLSV